MISRKKRIAEDMFEKCGNKAMLSLTDIMKYTGYGKNKLRRILADTCVIGHNTGKRYYYEDVAAAIEDQ